jgi:hypothetical protein
VGWRLPCDAAATERCVHLGDPVLEQECSEPYLTSADLHEKGALVLLKVLVFSECPLPFKFGVYIRRLYARTSLGPRPCLDLALPPKSPVPLYCLVRYQLPFSALPACPPCLLLSSFGQELRSYRPDSCPLPSEAGRHYGAGTAHLLSHARIFEPGLELCHSLVEVYVDRWDNLNQLLNIMYYYI